MSFGQATPSWLANYHIIMCLKSSAAGIWTLWSSLPATYDHNDGDNNAVVVCQGQLQGNIPQAVGIL